MDDKARLDFKHLDLHGVGAGIAQVDHRHGRARILPVAGLRMGITEKYRADASEILAARYGQPIPARAVVPGDALALDGLDASSVVVNAGSVRRIGEVKFRTGFARVERVDNVIIDKGVIHRNIAVGRPIVAQYGSLRLASADVADLGIEPDSFARCNRLRISSYAE